MRIDYMYHSPRKIFFQSHPHASNFHGYAHQVNGYIYIMSVDMDIMFVDMQIKAH